MNKKLLRLIASAILLLAAYLLTENVQMPMAVSYTHLTLPTN